MVTQLVLKSTNLRATPCLSWQELQNMHIEQKDLQEKKKNPCVSAQNNKSPNRNQQYSESPKNIK